MPPPRMPNLDKPREFSGFLNLNKPAGLTSRDVVDRVLRSLPRRTKAGHAGTLDPLATGVLVVAIGPGTRLIEAVQAQAKVYRTVVRLGARSDTLDADGTIEETPNPPQPTEDAIRDGPGTPDRSRSSRFPRRIPRSRSRESGPTTWRVPARMSRWSPDRSASTESTS